MENSTRCSAILYIVEMLNRVEKWLVISAKGKDTLVAKAHSNFSFDGDSQEHILPERRNSTTKKVSLRAFKLTVLGLKDAPEGMRAAVFSTLPAE